ncbi:hypothetical protein NTH60_004578 [Enterobacter ludwigii]|nr:hypothetical protein [Enterobacter ludwigii]
MFNLFSPKIKIVACLPEESSFRYRFMRSDTICVHISAIVQEIFQRMKPSYFTSVAMKRYPWCFVAPDDTHGPNYYFVGAFLPPLKKRETELTMLFSRVSESWLIPHLKSPVGLPLWLSRCLIPIINGSSPYVNHRDVRQNCFSLEHRLNSSMRLGYKFVGIKHRPRLEKLNSVCCEADEELLNEYGVDAMPWMDWPGCVQQRSAFWIWRQSRHGKVIESQKVLLKGILN